MADKVKDRVLDAVDGARVVLQKQVRGFAKQSVYYKRKVGVVAGYLVLCVLSLVVIPPSRQHNALDALIKVDAIGFGSRDRTFVEILNEGSSAWPEATVTVLGMNAKGKQESYTYRGKWLRGEKRALFTGEQFRDRAGKPGPVNLKIDEVTLEVGGVKVTRNPNAPPPPPP